MKLHCGRLGRVTLSVCLLLLSAICVTAAPQTGHIHKKSLAYATYYNGRFAYQISYPEHVLYPQGEAPNGNGQKFLSVHADAVMLVYGRWNVLNEKLNDLYDDAHCGDTSDHPKRVVTYRLFKKNWYVVSGYENGSIFYEKVMILKDAIMTMQFSYPERQKAYYAPITTAISKSFHTTSLSSL